MPDHITDMLEFLSTFASKAEDYTGELTIKPDIRFKLEDVVEEVDRLRGTLQTVLYDREKLCFPSCDDYCISYHSNSATCKKNIPICCVCKMTMGRDKIGDEMPEERVCDECATKENR